MKRKGFCSFCEKFREITKSFVASLEHGGPKLTFAVCYECQEKHDHPSPLGEP